MTIRRRTSAAGAALAAASTLADLRQAADPTNTDNRVSRYSRGTQRSALIRRIHLICLAVLAAAVAAPTALAGTTTVPASDDAWVTDRYPSRNYGTQSAMRSAAKPLKRSFVRFVVPSLDGPVEKAVLRVYAQTGASHGFRVSRTGTGWAERTITHGNAPALGTLVATVPAFSATNTWREIDVTSAVTGAGTYSFALTTPSSRGDVYFTTKEGGRAPQLVVTTGGDAPPPPPPPPSAEPPQNTSLPTVSGTAQQGQTITASPGAWSGTTPISYAYQWRRCDLAGSSCADVSGATGASYALGSADVNQTMRVRVTASNAAGSASATSAQTAAVQATPAPPPSEPVPGTTIYTDRSWQCNGSLSSFGPLPIKVVSQIPNPGTADAIRLIGCYGDGNPNTIDLILDVRGNNANIGTGYDAVKIGQNARDLVVTGTVACGATYGSVHQDVVQAMSGRNIEFRDFRSGNPETGEWTCWGAGGGWYVSHANGDIPTDLVCTRCSIATYNQNMRIDNAIRSGARDSTFGYSRSYGIFIGPQAVDPINVNNRVIRY